MAKFLLNHMDGRYTTKLLSEEEAAELEAKGEDLPNVQDSVYDAYIRHCAQDSAWQTLWQAIKNEQSLLRRQRELQPLEEAQREIERLREELARSERMSRYFENEWLLTTGRQPRADHERK